MKTLFLEDLKDLSEEEIKEHIKREYLPDNKDDDENFYNEINAIKILVAYESVGSWGCGSSSWFLVLKDGKLYETSGSHCSCYGFEGQWELEETTPEYLNSPKFYLSVGGYDNDEENNKTKLKEYLTNIQENIK